MKILFLSILAGKGINIKNNKGMLENIDVQIEFYENHINNWLHIFCKTLNQADSCPFYQIFALILQGYTEADYNILNELKRDID